MINVRHTMARGLRGVLPPELEIPGQPSGPDLPDDNSVRAYIYVVFEDVLRKSATREIADEILELVNDENPWFDYNPYAKISGEAVYLIVMQWADDNSDRVRALPNYPPFETGNGSSPGSGSSSGGDSAGGDSAGSGVETGSVGNGSGGLDRRPRSKSPQAGGVPSWVLPVAAGVGLGLLFVLFSKRGSRR